MLKPITLSLLLCACTALLPAQNLVSWNLLGAKTKAQLSAQFNLPFIQFGARFYKVAYTTPDLNGVQDTVSGLVVVPDNDSKIYPRLVYQHGTSSSKDNVPSSYGQPGGGEGDIPVLFAGMGFAALAPDYLGLGDSDGFHPYVHAESETRVALDMLRAFDEMKTQIGAHTHDQLFITGYSQGGHASMALHRAVESDPGEEFAVTAAAHMSGPYSIGEVMRDFLLSDTLYYYPGYVPNTLLSYQTVYGNLFDQIEDVFRPPYAALVGQYYAGQINLGDLNAQLIELLILNEGGCRPTRMLQESLKQEVATDPDHPVNVALRANNVYQWAPQAPTRLFYCQADDQVPCLNTWVARDTMLARGAADLAVSDPDPAANHVECVEPALIGALFSFLGYQQIGEVSAVDPFSQARMLRIFPNPAETFVQIDTRAGGDLTVYDTRGRLVAQKTIPGGLTEVSVSDWGKGLFLFVFQQSGVSVTATVMVK